MVFWAAAIFQEFGVPGLGSRVWGPGFGVPGLGFQVWGAFWLFPWAPSPRLLKKSKLLNQIM